MKIITILAICCAISGCSGLNVSWALTATYNTPATTSVTMTPGAERAEAAKK